MKLLKLGHLHHGAVLLIQSVHSIIKTKLECVEVIMQPQQEVFVRKYVQKTGLFQGDQLNVADELQGREEVR